MIPGTILNRRWLKLLDMVLNLAMMISAFYVNPSKQCRNRICSTQFKDDRYPCVFEKLLVFGSFFKL